MTDTDLNVTFDTAEARDRHLQKLVMANLIRSGTPSRVGKAFSYRGYMCVRNYPGGYITPASLLWLKKGKTK